MSQVDQLDVLTPAERRVVDLVLTGARNREIATELELSERTVESHLASSYKKLRVQSRAQLISRVLMS